jgi:hypothetical protein
MNHSYHGEVAHGVAETRVEDLDADLVLLGRSDLDVLDRERLARFPGDGSLALDNLDMRNIQSIRIRWLARVDTYIPVQQSTFGLFCWKKKGEDEDDISPPVARIRFFRFAGFAAALLLNNAILLWIFFSLVPWIIYRAVHTHIHSAVYFFEMLCPLHTCNSVFFHFPRFSRHSSLLMTLCFSCRIKQICYAETICTLARWHI